MADLVDIAIPMSAQQGAETLGLKVIRNITSGAWVRRIPRDEAETAVEYLRGIAARIVARGPRATRHLILTFVARHRVPVTLLNRSGVFYERENNALGSSEAKSSLMTSIFVRAIEKRRRACLTSYLGVRGGEQGEVDERAQLRSNRRGPRYKFTVEGPMTDDHPWNIAAANAHDFDRNIGCFGIGDLTPDAAAAEWQAAFGGKRLRPAPSYRRKFTLSRPVPTS
jgi:hypothetical protein